MSIRIIKGIEFKPLYPDADKDLARRWVAELRNPTRTQAQGALRTDDGMCCLGVLCDITNPDGWERVTYASEVDEYGWTFEVAGFAVPPFELVKQLTGLTEAPLMIELGKDDEGRSVSASELNDLCAFTFAEIAAAVEVAFDLV